MTDAVFNCSDFFTYVSMLNPYHFCSSVRSMDGKRNTAVLSITALGGGSETRSRYLKFARGFMFHGSESPALPMEQHAGSQEVEQELY